MYHARIGSLANHWLMSTKIKVFDYDTKPKGIIFITNDDISILKIVVDKVTAKLLMKLRTTGAQQNVFFPTMPSLTPLNEPWLMTVYQVFDSFLQKYVVRVRVNGTVISTTEWNVSPPIYGNVKLHTIDNIPVASVSLSNLYLLEIP